MAEFDFSEIDQLAADLGEVADNAGPNIRKAIEVTALRIKKDWQEPLKGSATLPGLFYALSYDVDLLQGFGASVLKAEIGFDPDRFQGRLDNISEFGTPTVTGRGFGLRALEKNQADFEKGLDIALEQAERKGNL